MFLMSWYQSVWLTHKRSPLSCNGWGTASICVPRSTQQRWVRQTEEATKIPFGMTEGRQWERECAVSGYLIQQRWITWVPLFVIKLRLLLLINYVNNEQAAVGACPYSLSVVGEIPSCSVPEVIAPCKDTGQCDREPEENNKVNRHCNSRLVWKSRSTVQNNSKYISGDWVMKNLVGVHYCHRGWLSVIGNSLSRIVP